MDLGTVYTNTRRSAAAMGLRRLRWTARRARRRFGSGQFDGVAQVRAVAFEHELTARGARGRPPSLAERFHRLV